MLKAVIKIGGFAFPPDVSSDMVNAYSKVIRSFSKKNRLAVVTGGGMLARKYIAAARQLGASECVCDQIGIQVSRLNARLLVAALGDTAYPHVAESLADYLSYSTSGLIVVMGGFQPGQSTNAVAALAAESIGADRLINVTDVNGVYSANPEKDQLARKLDQVTVDELMKILSSERTEAGEYALMDPLALGIVKRSRILTIVVNGHDPSNLRKALEGRRIGTTVVPSK